MNTTFFFSWLDLKPPITDYFSIWLRELLMLLCKFEYLCSYIIRCKFCIYRALNIRPRLTSGHQFENKLWVCNIGAGNLTATNLHALLWNTTSNSVWKVSRKISQVKNLKLSQLTTMKMYSHIVHLLLRELRWWG